MQIELIQVLRRVQGRVPLPWVQAEPQWIDGEQRAGRSLVRFEDIPLDWTEFRLTLRQTADILHRYETLDRTEHQQIVGLARDGNKLEPIVQRWYAATSQAAEGSDRERMPGHVPPSLEHVLVLAMRPFLARSAEALMQRSDFSAWNRGHCPLCYWEADFAFIAPTGTRHLICGRCLAQWPFDLVCPFCGNGDRALITSFATRDGRYRVYACDQCRRYLKAYDARNASRPVMVAVDSIATLPLDAAAMQRGYSA
jgi:hypothetical protein